MKISKAIPREATRILYEIEKLPVVQNRVYDSEEEARNCPRGDMFCRKSYNESFLPELVTYDDHYQNGGSIFMMNSNYLQEIKAMTGNKFNYVSIDNG